MIAVDDEQLLLSEVSDDVHEKAQENSENGDSKPKVADWRYGPAQVWYDMLDVPDSGYVSFKLSNNQKTCLNCKNPSVLHFTQ